MTLKVWGAGCDAFWRFDRKTLSFTPQNWNVPQSVAFSVEDFGAGDYTAAVVCGTGGTDFSSAYTAVSVTGRAFTPPSDPGAVTLYDTMTISGTAGTAGSGVRVLTDYVPKWNTIVRTKYADDPAASTPQFLFCTREAWNSRMFGWMPAYNNKKQCWWNCNTSQIQSWDNVASTDEVFLEVKNGDAVLTRLWDESHWYLTNTVPVQAFDPMYRMALFQSYTISGGNYGNWSNSFRGDFHYLQVFEWEDGHEVLKHHFVPCTSNGVVKVCDIADGNRIYDITATSGGAVDIGANAQAIGLILPDDSLIPDNPVAYGQLDMSAFSKKMTVTFAGAQSGTTLTDFPVLVKLSTAINGFSYSDFQLSNGADLRFADATGKLLPHEIDTWNPSGVSTVWVKVPSLTKDTAITACWGCAEPPEVAAKDVWDAGYVGVWHLGESALPMKESSGTSSDFATKSGTVGYGAEGAVGGAVDFSQATTKNYLMAADDDDLDGFADFTVEVWTRQDAFRTDGNYAGMLSKRNSFYNQESYFFYQNNTSGNTKPVFAFNTNSTSSARASVWAGVLPETGRWTHNAFTRNSGTGGVALYLNGTSRGTGTSGKDNVFAGTAPLYIGCDPAQQSFPGRIDEVRISKVARSAAWVKATHDTIADDAFATYAVEGAGPVEPGRILYVTVASGETDTLDAALVTSYITNIVKRGAGTLVASAIPNYTGTITVNGGVWRGGASAGDFGSEGTVIDVEDGASLELAGANGACPVANALSGRTINLYGAKCASASGKIQIFGNGSATIAFGENVSINLKDADSLIYVNNAKWDTCNFKSGAVNLDGKTLTIQATRQIQMGLAFSNGGAVVLKGTALYVEWNGMCPSFSGTGVFQGDSPMNIKKKIDAPGWTLKTSHQLYGNVNAMPTKTEFPGWEGPVEFSWNSVQVANYAGASAGTSNTVFNLKGAVSGSGALRIGPGWVNLHSADNTYRGAVYVNGQAVGSGATILPGGGGIGLWNGAACFPDASSVTFTNTARLAFMDSTHEDRSGPSRVQLACRRCGRPRPRRHAQGDAQGRGRGVARDADREAAAVREAGIRVRHNLRPLGQHRGQGGRSRRRADGHERRHLRRDGELEAVRSRRRADAEGRERHVQRAVCRRNARLRGGRDVHDRGRGGVLERGCGRRIRRTCRRPRELGVGRLDARQWHGGRPASAFRRHGAPLGDGCRRRRNDAPAQVRGIRRLRRLGGGEQHLRHACGEDERNRERHPLRLRHRPGGFGHRHAGHPGRARRGRQSRGAGARPRGRARRPVVWRFGDREPGRLERRHARSDEEVRDRRVLEARRERKQPELRVPVQDVLQVHDRRPLGPRRRPCQ